MAYKQEQNQLLIVPILLFTIMPILALPLSEFYPFGEFQGDSSVPANDDESSGEVQLSIPFPYFDKNHESLFVNTNGAISFLEEIQQYTPDPFPLGNGRRLVAPFWADVDTRKGGRVWYKETTDRTLLNRATKDVTDTFVGQYRFRATWLFIATWDNVAFFGAESVHLNKRNTFQAILITNGRHSFVIFNYNKIEWTTGTASNGQVDGLGGKPAQAGFNAGDGIRFFSIAGSRTGDVINLPLTSNIGKFGRWMFRIDEAVIEAGGCNTRGSLTIFPSAGTMLGGDNIAVAGPCFNSSAHQLVCRFSDELTHGAVVNGLRGVCTVPAMHVTGQIALSVSINGGKNFKFTGTYTLLPINQIRPLVNRTQVFAGLALEQQPMNLTWDPRLLGARDTQVFIDMVRYVMDQDQVKIHSVFPLVRNQTNTGHSMVTVRDGEGEGKQAGRFITIIRVKKTGNLIKMQNSRHQWIWSELFVWDNLDTGRANGRCLKWYDKQPNPEAYTSDPSFLPCPRTLRQAQADRGRYTADEHCNPKNTAGCSLYHSSAHLCVRSIRASNKGAGTQCCYSREGNLLVGPPYAGSLDRVHVDIGIPVISHFFHDIVPYHDCCRWSSNCDKYFEKRPSDDGSRYQPPRPTTGFGDPHIITLDGMEFTFNGYGEYTMLKINSTDFILQGRMQPLNDDGLTTTATLFTAFAMKENGSDTVEISLNGRGMVDVLINGVVVEFEEQIMVKFSGVSVLNYENKSKYLVTLSSGVSVTIEGHRDLLQIMLLVPSDYKGLTSGLLGYWDDDKDKEFLTSSGKFVNSSSSQETLHYTFGESWRIKVESESLFTYMEGLSLLSYSRPFYKPGFLDRKDLKFSNKALEVKARAACGSNIRCLFDIHTTSKVAIGIATKQATEEYAVLLQDTDSKGCIPLNPSLSDGRINRADTKDGITYRFTCSNGYELIGSSHVSCYNDTYDDAPPTCEATSKGGGEKYYEIKEQVMASDEENHLYTFVIVFVLVALFSVVVLVVLVRRRSSKRLEETSNNSIYSGTETKEKEGGQLNAVMLERREATRPHSKPACH